MPLSEHTSYSSAGGFNAPRRPTTPPCLPGSCPPAIAKTLCLLVPPSPRCPSWPPTKPPAGSNSHHASWPIAPAAQAGERTVPRARDVQVRALDAHRASTPQPSLTQEPSRYEPSLPTRIKYNNAADNPIPSSQLVSSDDTILTALAQLGACQTGTARSLISLFDQSHQYIVAEATPTLPLVPGLRHQDRDEDLWLCGTAIPRRHGMCEHSLCGPDAGSTGQLPLSLVVDLQTDPRFSCKPYCRPGSPARFYAAVPIRTQRGINIGVFCVIDSEPRDDWDDARTQLMRNISRSIMVHLDAKRAAANYRRGVRMNSGVASFIEGEATVSGWRSGPNPAAFEDDDRLEGMLNVHQQSYQRDQDDVTEAADQVSANLVAQPLSGPFLGSSEEKSPAPVTQARPSAGDHRQDLVNAQTTSVPGVDHSAPENPMKIIFSKAANIIRESVEVEGVLFVDARVTTSGGLRRGSGSDDWSRPRDTPSSQSGSDESNSSSTGKVFAWSEVLGFSTSDASSIDRAKPTQLHASMPERLISKLLRRYPKGKIFSFDANGELQSSDSSEDDIRSLTPAGDASISLPTLSASTKRKQQPWARHREGCTILETFAGARSVAFVPLWDSKKERWAAGCFAYTRTPTRIFTIDVELSYLRSFGMLAMSEVSRLDTQLASRAKSDVLGAISHELRSPLHGVLLGAELLNDTAVSAFQGNILHTIETCGRTLKDTLDHLLDFAKINNYKTSRKDQGFKSIHGRESQLKGAGSFEAGMMNLYTYSRVDNLAEEVVESVFAGFNFQYASVAQLQKHRSGQMPNEPDDVHAHRRLDYLHATDDLGPSLTKQGDIQTDFGKVSILMDIDPGCSWMFHIQPGAFRRVLMNVFGNALKYTGQGAITVRLRQEPSSRRRPAPEQTLKMTVTDTGKGIGGDFLRNDLFKPFLQEDHLSPGTGLGLSIVKQITSQLGGSISVDSLPGVGTTVSISLPMGKAVTTPADHAAGMQVDDQDFKKHVAELKGLRVRLVGFDSDYSQASSEPRYGLAESICRDWLHMEVISQSQHQQIAADLLLVAEHILPQVTNLSGSDAPVVVVCANALAAYHHSAVAERKSSERVFEFISQP